MRNDHQVILLAVGVAAVIWYITKGKAGTAPAPARAGAVSGSPDAIFSNVTPNAFGERVINYGGGIQYIKESNGAMSVSDGQGHVSYWSPEGSFIGTFAA